MRAGIQKTLHELVGNGIHAYTQLPCRWGWSNSGLITDGDESLLVDTLFDLRITKEMLHENTNDTSEDAEALNPELWAIIPDAADPQPIRTIQTP